MMIETDYFTLHNIADGVYAAIAKKGTGAGSNVGFVDIGNEVVVFDAFSTPSAARELRRLAEEITGNKVSYLINSHHHGDHVFGNQVFKDTTILSTTISRRLNMEQNIIGDLEKEQSEMETYLKGLQKEIDQATTPILKQSLLNQYNEMAKVLEDLPEMEMVYPMVTFENHLVIYGTKRNVELYCFGGGHTPSDTFMYIPDEKIAFMGDIITDGIHLPIHNPEEFIKILNRVMKMEINIMIPGHGEIGTMTLCEDLLNYISTIIEHVKKAKSENVTLEQFQDAFSLPEKYANWLGLNGIERNLTTVYNFYNK